MADQVYLVTRDEQDQYVRLLDIGDSATIYAVRDTFRPVLGARTAATAQADSRRGGTVQVGERREPASVGGTFMVKGSTADLALARAESLLAEADAAARDRWVWWKPDGASRVSLYPLIGPVSSATVNYTWAQFASGFFPIDVSWPCQPWAESLVQDMDDDFRNRDAGSALAQLQADYTTTVVPASVARGALELPTGLANSNASKIVRLDRQPFRDGWVTVKGKAKTGSTNAGLVLTPGLRYTPADGKYIFAQLTTTQLIVVEWDGAAFTSRATAAQTSPAVNTSFWIRIRAEGQKVTAEYWSTPPTPYGTPDKTVTWDDPASVRTGYPVLTARGPGAGITPVIEAFEVRPYSWRLVNTPAVIAVEELPGTREAAVDFDFTSSSTDTDYARHLLLGWRRAKAAAAAPLAGVTTHTSLLLPGETGAASGATAVVTDVTKYRGASGQAMGFTTSAVASNGSAVWWFDPSIFEPDDFASTVTLAVVVRYWRNTGVVTPRLSASLNAAGSPAQPTPEFGATGRYLPALTSAGVRSTTLGTITVEPLPQVVNVALTLFWGVGSPAAVSFAVDELYLVPVAALSLSATDKDRDDGTYPAVSSPQAPTTANRTRRVRSDLSGAFRELYVGAPGPYFASAPLNMGGAQLLMPVASEGVELLVRPSVSVPDDPVRSTVGDILSHNVTAHARVTPRYHLFAA